MRLSPLAFLLLAACPGPPKSAPGPQPPDIRMERVTLRTFQGSQAQAVLTAPTLELSRSGGTFTLWDASVRLEAQGLTIDAPRVDGSLTGGVLHGSGGIVARTDQGARATAPSATFDRSLGPQGGASSDAGVRLEDPRFTLEARGFQVDFAAETATFDAPVTKSR
ncbi:MAG: hypothetical protein AMXMBFR34_40880 [Myxococcaceae bacterium]